MPLGAGSSDEVFGIAPARQLDPGAPSAPTNPMLIAAAAGDGQKIVKMKEELWPAM